MSSDLCEEFRVKLSEVAQASDKDALWVPLSGGLLGTPTGWRPYSGPGLVMPQDPLEGAGHREYLVQSAAPTNI